MAIFNQNTKAITNLRMFLDLLKRENEVVVISEEVDPYLEIAEIHRRVIGASGPALLFTRVKGSSFPVVTNLFGSEKRMNLAFPQNPEKFVETMVSLIQEELPPKINSLWKNRKELSKIFSLGIKHKTKGPVLECEIIPADLEQLPLLHCWPEDGGHFITLPLVYTESPEKRSSSNLGMYRIQRFDKTTTGLHFQIGKGGGFHYFQAENKNENLPVSIFIGGAPALILSAIAPLPENVPELILASLLQGKKLDITKNNRHQHPLISECEFALIGHAKPKERKLEGPFGDHFGYYSLAHDFPVFTCEKIYHRKNAIYPATVVGKPVQEDLYIGNFLQKLLSPLFPVVMPTVKNLHTYSESGFHPLAAAQVQERYEKECIQSAFRILGEGQLSLTKFLLLTDQPIELENFKLVFETILARFRPERDLYIISHVSNDTLDYTGPKLNHGSKAILIGVGEKRRILPTRFSGILPKPFKKAVVFCDGCLVLEGPSFTEWNDFSDILHHESFHEWPCLVLVDDAVQTSKSQLEFLWTVFTRFDPATDIFTKNLTIKNHHISYSIPLLIDARMKPHYPKELQPDEHTKKLVDAKWKNYFPTEKIKT